MEHSHLIPVSTARRLALCRGGLLKPDWIGLPRGAGRGTESARRAAHRVIGAFGYLQCDTVSVAGARSHSIVVMSRLAPFRAEIGETLLRPGEPLFEYWAHEVCWVPMELYPLFGWRRQQIRRRPWWREAVDRHPDLAREIVSRIRSDGPIRSSDLEGASGKGWWDHKPAKTIAVALWSSGDLAIRERRAFQRTFDLPERVIPAEWLHAPEIPQPDAIRALFLKSLQGHGWAQTRTLVQTFRLRWLKNETRRALCELNESGDIVSCALVLADGRKVPGWIRPQDLELAGRLERLRPSAADPVLLSPFDPVLWDRTRLAQLFDFAMTVEIFVPKEKRKFGYYCLPVLAGETLLGRVDLKAERRGGLLHVRSRHLEPGAVRAWGRSTVEQAFRNAILRYAEQVGLTQAPRARDQRKAGSR